MVPLVHSGGHASSPMRDPLSIFVPANRRKLLLAAGVFGTAIAILDWRTEPYISLGFLYLFPIMIAGGYLSRKAIIIVALLCAGLDFSNLPTNKHEDENQNDSERFIHLVFSSVGFLGTGLFISEVSRNRRIALQRHADELADQVKRRQEAEEHFDVLVESSPAAIVTIGSDGKILLYNEAAQRLMAPEAEPLRGQSISAYLPALQQAVETPSSTVFRTTMQCTGRRPNGELFLAGVWFSTYRTVSGPRLAAIIVDLSEDLRSREDLSLDYLLKKKPHSHECRGPRGSEFVRCSAGGLQQSFPG